MTPTEEDPDAPEAELGERRRVGNRSRRLRLSFIGVLVVVALAAVAWATTLVLAGDDDASLTEAREVAGQFGAAYLSFDAASVNDATTALLALATDRFAREFESSRLPSVEALFTDSDTSTTTEVTDIFTTAVEDGRVRALVVVDVDATGSEGSQSLVDLSFVLELVQSGGTWRVDAVAPLPVPRVVGGPGSSTSVPAPTSTTVATTQPPPPG